MSIGSPLREPCASCGEETASGSIFYSGRHTITHADDTRAFCASLQRPDPLVPPRGGMTDDEVRSYVENGSNAGITWGNGGAMGV